MQVRACCSRKPSFDGHEALLEAELSGPKQCCMAANAGHPAAVHSSKRDSQAGQGYETVQHLKQARAGCSRIRSARAHQAVLEAECSGPSRA